MSPRKHGRSDTSPTTFDLHKDFVRRAVGSMQDGYTGHPLASDDRNFGLPPPKPC
jgi:hypothetical protein